jgi:eukaryotic-like serine/threonine-protein kinase
MAAARVKGYELIAQVGAGACSTIWRARDLKTGSICAVKIASRREGADSRHFRQMVNEFRVTRRLNHPNLARIDEIIPSRVLFWTYRMALAMEYVPGVTLAQLRERESLDAKRLVNIYIQLADGLGFMHSQDIIHLDMKPHNVIITPEGQAKIVDFGLARSKGNYNSRVQGTPDFMAPEQIRMGWVDERTDVYNLGATMFYLVTGKSVQMTLTSRNGHGNGNGKAVVESQTFRSMEVEVPDALESLILASCRQAPAERPHTMAQVVAELRTIAAELKLHPVKTPS